MSVEMLILSILRYSKGCYIALFNQREISSVLTFLSFLMYVSLKSVHIREAHYFKENQQRVFTKSTRCWAGTQWNLNTIPPKLVPSSSNFLFKAYIWWMSFHLLNGIKIESYQYYFPKPSHPLVWVIQWNLPVFFFFSLSLFSHTFHYT